MQADTAQAGAQVSTDALGRAAHSLAMVYACLCFSASTVLTLLESAIMPVILGACLFGLRQLRLLLAIGFV